MATTTDFLNEVLDAVKTTLAASTLFMAAGSLSGGTGVVKTVERRAMPKLTRIQQSALPYAGVAHDEDHTEYDQSSLGETEIFVNVAVWLYDRGADSEVLERNLLQAKAALVRIVDTEMRGGRFDGKCGNAHYLGGPTADVEDETRDDFGLITVARIQLWVPRAPTG